MQIAPVPTRRKYVFKVALLVLGGVAGCATAPPKAYPVSPPLTASGSAQPAMATTIPAVVKIPADAIELSNGNYPPPGFPEPSQPGLLMVVDLDGDPTIAVASTSVTGKDAGKVMSITDVANMSITMNKAHRYRIVFVPNKTAAP